MTLYVGSSGNKTVTGVTIGTAGGNKNVLTAYVGTAGGNKIFYAATFPASATLSYGWTLFDDTYIADVLATPLGGVGPYTYDWSISSGGAGVFISPSGPGECQFFSSDAPATQVLCTITDANGAIGITNAVAL